MCTALRIDCICIDEEAFDLTHISFEKEGCSEIGDRPSNFRIEATKCARFEKYLQVYEESCCFDMN